MRRTFAAISAAIALAACQPAADRAEKSAAATPAAGCVAEASRDWTAGASTYRIEAFARGPTCAQAALTLVIRTPEGAVAYADVLQAQYLMPFQGVPDDQFAQTVTDFLGKPQDDEPSGTLPAWAPEADMPVRGEFPFYVAEGMDRDAYEAVRAANVPMFCYVQGMESLDCLVLQNGEVYSVGAQAFPG